MICTKIPFLYYKRVLLEKKNYSLCTKITNFVKDVNINLVLQSI